MVKCGILPSDRLPLQCGGYYGRDDVSESLPDVSGSTWECCPKDDTTTRYDVHYQPTRAHSIPPRARTPRWAEALCTAASITLSPTVLLLVIIAVLLYRL